MEADGLEVAADRDWATAPAAELEAEIDRLDDEHRVLHSRQLAEPDIDGEPRAGLIAQMDAVDRRRRDLSKLLPVEAEAEAETEVEEEPKFGESGYEPPENWRTSLYQARRYAKDMGIPSERGYAGKELPQVVAMIEAKLDIKPAKSNKAQKIKAKRESKLASGEHRIRYSIASEHFTSCIG